MLRKPPNRICPEMIVVIVRNHNGINGGQIFQCERCRKETLGAGPLHRGRTFIPDWIDEETDSVDFNQRRGVPHPGNAQAGLRGSFVYTRGSV